MMIFPRFLTWCEKTLTRSDDGMGFPDRYRNWTKFINFSVAYLHRRFGLRRVRAHPSFLVVEPTNACNLNCPFCATGRGWYGRDKTRMSLETYRRIIDELGRYAYRVELFNWGEPMLCPDIFEMVRYAEQRDIMTCIATNFNVSFDGEMAEKLVLSGLSFLMVSIDGTDQASYSRYRRGGSFDRVVSNVRTLVETRARLGASNPEISWMYLVFSHNEDRIETARAMAAELGVDGFRVQVPTVDDARWLPRKEYEVPWGLVEEKCSWLWHQAVVHADGAVAPCCIAYDRKDDFGTVANGGFMGVWNSKKYQQARGLFSSRPQETPQEYHQCKRCFKVTRRRGDHKA